MNELLIIYKIEYFLKKKVAFTDIMCQNVYSKGIYGTRERTTAENTISAINYSRCDMGQYMEV